jgi:serine O-acetyltransferase
MKTLIADIKYKQQIFIQDSKGVSLLKVCLSDGTSANVLYRLMRFFARYKLCLPLAVIAQYLNKLLNHCMIGIRADFGPGFVLMHPTGVVINSKVLGGQNIVVESGVVIGDEKGLSPKLENNIFIGTGAKIIGRLTVGANSKIGANAVVVKDVAPGDSVGGVPAKKLNKNKPNK